MMLGMSQEKLSDALGLTFQQVRKYEKGPNRIGASHLLHIACMLRMPVAFFFDGGPAAPRSLWHFRDPVTGPRLRFSNDKGRARAVQSVHGHQGWQTSPLHRCTR